MKRSFLLLATILSSCGVESENYELHDRVDTEVGTYQRDYIVERSDGVSNPVPLANSTLGYFPAQISPEIISEDFFWVIDQRVSPAIAPDPDRTHTDELLLALDAPRGTNAFTGTLFHTEYAGLENIAQWVLEFRPLVKARSKSGSDAFQIEMKIDHVCYQAANEEMDILYHDQDVLLSPMARLNQTFQEFKVTKTYRSDDAVNHLTKCRDMGGSLSSSVTLRDTGSRNSDREVQFIDLRIIKQESF